MAVHKNDGILRCTGGPNVVLSAHNSASRRASDTQVTFTDVVTPTPAVRMGLHVHCPCMHANVIVSQSVHHHAIIYKQLNIYNYDTHGTCWLTVCASSITL